MAGGPVNACATNNCSGTNNPNMQLTVTGASGSITWCGETWNLPGDSGDTRCVCPDSYNLNTNYTAASTYNYGENWANNNGASDSLVLIRNANVSFTGLLYTFGNEVRLKNNAGRNRYLWNFASPTAYGTIATPAGFTPLNGVAKPNRAGAYRLGSEWFSTVTISGITYTWEQGINW